MNAAPISSRPPATPPERVPVRFLLQLLPPANQPRRQAELSRLLENLTVNETSFFRNKAQLDLFHKYILDEIFSQASRSADYSLRFWSAGCSTGQEPYTIAMLVADALAYYYLRNPLPFDMPLPKPLIPPPWRVEIMASDISYSVLRAAQEGVYSETQMASVDYSYRLRYFDKVGDRYAIKKAVKELVHFDFHNLKTEYLAAAQRRDLLPQRDDVLRRGRTETADRQVLSLSEPGMAFSVRRSRGEPARPDRQVSDGSRNSGTAYQRSRGDGVSRSDERGAEMRELFFETAAELLQALNEDALSSKRHPATRSLRSIRRTVHTPQRRCCGLRLSRIERTFSRIGRCAGARVGVRTCVLGRRHLCSGRRFHRHARRLSPF